MSSYTDVSAWICYLIIAVIGAIVSFYHVNSKLYGAKILWLRVELWVVYFLYILFPLTLFWLLDASGEVKDTSLLWAVLIALVYRKILAGESDKIKAPDVLAGYWVSLESLIEKLIENWGDSVHNFNQWQHRAIQRRLSEANHDKLAHLIAFAQRMNIPVSDTMLATIASGGQVDRQEMAALSEQTYMAAMKKYRNDIPDIFVEEKVLSMWEVIFHCKFQLRQVITSSLFTVILASSTYFLIQVVRSDSFHPELDYYVWRLGKSNTSEKDVHRNCRQIIKLMKSKDMALHKKQYLVNNLLNKLYSVDITAERAQKIAKIFIEMKDYIHNKEQFLVDLAEILRSERIEIRVIVQSNLLFLAQSYDKTIPNSLLNAEVSKDLKDDETEQIIALWASLE